jgi:DNA-binding transcriptional LysR family regulator
MLDTHQLNIFLTAAETLSFTQAAQKLHMTQPSVSQHIQALERRFGTELFIRNGRSLELTDAGLALVPLAREAVSLSVRTEEAMRSVKGDVVGHLMVGCSTTPGKYVLPQLLARFHQRYPQVRVTCQVSSQQIAMQMLTEGGVHFALTSLIEGSEPELEMSRFLCDKVILIAPKDHPWSKSGRVAPKDLTSATFIMREDSAGTYAAVRDALAKAGISIHDFNTLLTLGNAEAIAMAVQEGLGVGFISEMVVDRLGPGRVVRIEIDEVEIYRDIYLSRNTRRPATIAQNAFWEFVHSKDNPLYCLDETPRERLAPVT